MDSVDAPDLTSLLGNLAQTTAAHDKQITDLSKATNEPVTSAPVTLEPLSAPAVSSPAREPHLLYPERFSGEPEMCLPFLMQCAAIFELQPSVFPSDRSKVAYVISLLTCQAR
ncbi:protein LDOC1-like, partial [Tachysurus ichikawai]